MCKEVEGFRLRGGGGCWRARAARRAARRRRAKLLALAVGADADAACARASIMRLATAPRALHQRLQATHPKGIYICTPAPRGCCSPAGARGERDEGHKSEGERHSPALHHERIETVTSGRVYVVCFCVLDVGMNVKRGLGWSAYQDIAQRRCSWRSKMRSAWVCSSSEQPASAACCRHHTHLLPVPQTPALTAFLVTC